MVLAAVAAAAPALIFGYIYGYPAFLDPVRDELFVHPIAFGPMDDEFLGDAELFFDDDW